MCNILVSITRLGLCLVGTLSAAIVSAATLVEGGKAKAVIVIPASGRSAAAEDLQHYLEKSSGARLPIISEDRLADDPAAGCRIFVGPCAAATGVVDLSRLQPEGFVIKARGDDVFIVGRDQTEAGLPVSGTFYGVCEFLERYVGVRWLMPGPLGEVVPKRSALRVDSADVREEPALWQRRIRDGRTVSHRKLVEEILAQWKVPLATWQATFSRDITGPWFERQRLGSRVTLQFGHSYGGWYKKYHEQYPEIFALQPDGTRVNTTDRERLCVSNPTLWDLVAKDRVAQLRANPAMTGVSIAPNDGGVSRFCSCENCRGWDSPEAQAMYKANPKLDPGPGRSGNYPPLSDRFFRYFNEVAKRVKAEMPGRFVCTYAYSLYRTPPTSIDKLEDNLVIGYVAPNVFVSDKQREEARREFAEWSKKTGQIMLRPNMLYNPIGLPVNYVRGLGEDLRFFYEHGMRMTDFDTCLGNWGTQGIIYYVLAKLLWDPTRSVDPIIDDYCRAAYGAGAAHAKEYYERLEALTKTISAASLPNFENNLIADYFTDQELAALRFPLDQAIDAIGDTDDAARRRVQLLITGLDYARQTRRLLRAAADVRKGKMNQQQFAAVKAEVLPFYATLATGWAVAPEQNFWRIRRGLNLDPEADAAVVDPDTPDDLVRKKRSKKG